MSAKRLRRYPSDVFDPVLARLRADAARHVGAVDVRLEPFSYQKRPFSHVLRVGVYPSSSDSPALYLYVKVFKTKTPEGAVEMRARVAQDFSFTHHIYDFMSQWDGLDAVRPVACYADLLASVTEEARGRTLLQQLEREARWFPARISINGLTSTMERVGEWLRAFHGFDPRPSSIAVADLRQYVDVRLQRLVVEGQIINTAERQRILEYLDYLGSRVRPGDLQEVVVHADMAPGNILVSGPRIVVLDFAMSNRGSSLHDISRLFLQIDLLRAKPQFRPYVVEQLQAALLRGFDPSLTSAHPLFRMLSMLHRVNHFATLSLRRESFPANVLSRRVRQLHRRWIAAELENR